MNRIKTIVITIALLMLLLFRNVEAQTARTFSLAEVYELAITNSTQLKSAKVELEMSKASTQLVRTALTPSLDVSLSASYIGNGFITDRDLSNVTEIEMPHLGDSFGIEASQVIFAGGAISTNIQKARLEEQVVNLSYDCNELDICFLVTGYYIDLYKLSNQRTIFLKNIEQTSILIEQIKSKESEGMALGNDVTRHELMLQNLRLALIEVDNNRNIINRQMVVTLGLPAETVIMPDSSIFKLDLKTVSSDSLIQLSEENLPELKIAVLNKEIAAKELRIAKAEYYPQIALVAADSFNGPILIEVPVINKNFNYWYVGVGLKYNIASLYKADRKVHVAHHRQVVASYSEELAREHSQVTVYNAYTKFRESIEKLTVYETSLRLARENYRVINNRYLSELALITEMLDASNSRLNAELQVVNARLDVIYNYYRLQRETGNKIRN